MIPPVVASERGRALGWEGIYYIVIQQVSLLIEHNHLASSPDAWVYSHHAFLSERRIKEQLPGVPLGFSSVGAPGSRAFSMLEIR